MKKVLFGGIFDLLHLGHVLQIQKAKTFGYLIVNIGSDKQAKIKGEDRPIIPQEERKKMVEALRDVDKVVCMDTEKLDLPLLLNFVNPDILITNDDNDDYDEECKARNIEVVKLPRKICKSGGTTGIINKIKRR